ncbi:MAG: hypothetical protein FWC36_00085, partial [Spirochaetes bacterium]|nr:hypothetical protein [Spirochaetota bacterium]
ILYWEQKPFFFWYWQVGIKKQFDWNKIENILIKRTLYFSDNQQKRIKPYFYHFHDNDIVLFLASGLNYLKKQNSI